MAKMGVPKGYKRSPEHNANIQKAHAKVRAAKRKLGLRWSDPLPPGHPLAKKPPKNPRKAKTNGATHAKANGNGADHQAAIEATLAAATSSDAGGTSFPLDLIPERPPKPVKRAYNGARPHAQPTMPAERYAKLQLAAALIQAVNKILD